MSMEQGKRFIEGMQNRILRAANTAALGIVEKWDNGRADVALYPDEDLILGVPVASMQSGDFFVRITPKKGDLVTVVFLQHDIDGPLAGKKPETDRAKDINDAVIVGVINLDTEPWPVTMPGAALIGSKSSPAYIALTADGKVLIEAPGGFSAKGSTEKRSW